MKEIQRKIVGAVIVSTDGQVFLGKRNPEKGGVYAGSWIIPGGGIESGESPDEALIREIKEELDLDISSSILELVDDTRTGQSIKRLPQANESVLCNMHFYEYRVRLAYPADQIKISLCDEFSEYGWFTSASLSEIKLAPPTRELFAKMGLV